MSASALKDEVRDEAGECAFCGISNSAHREEYGEQLHVHRIVPSRAGGEYRRNNVVVVCTGCHDVMERTQARAINRVVGGRGNDIEDLEQLKDQRDALLERVESLERAVRSPEYYADVLAGFSVHGEVVAEWMGTKTGVYDDSEKAREAYEEWGSSLRRVKLTASEEDIESTVRSDLNSGYPRIERQLENMGAGR